MSKPNFAAGLKKIAPDPVIVEPPAPEERGFVRPPSRMTNTGEKKVAIAAYFEPEVRKQFAILSVRQDKTQAAMLAEALNLLFEKYGESPIARA